MPVKKKIKEHDAYDFAIATKTTHFKLFCYFNSTLTTTNLDLLINPCSFDKDTSHSEDKRL